MYPYKVILDTDIGDDIDDAFALALILVSREFDLLGVTTVFKNTESRSRLARTILKCAGKSNIPVTCGCGAVISTKIDLPFNPCEAYLNSELHCQEKASLPEAELPSIDKRHGVDFIIDTVLQGNGDINIISIGPMTNIAMAIVKEPKIIKKIPKIISMSGVLDGRCSEWNIRLDPIAAEIVFKSDIPMDIVGLDVTSKMELPDVVTQLRANQHPLIKKLLETYELWKKLAGIQNGVPILHDPLAIETMISPSIVKWHTGSVSVELNDTNYGFIHFDRSKGCNHRFAYEVDVNAALSLWLDRILSIS
ncbi:MAG: hypothetical protein A2Y12_00040 [Planctomycetes bacterium GWF2_42_9]|nr:MAG: hypothetical protein A2Y12_00040 [Planctomycetes bacterium GWF2_42_9]